MEGDSRPTKRQKTAHGEDETDDKYRQMLTTVAQHLGKEQVRRLARIANLSSLEQDEILQKQEGWPDALLGKLEEKGKINSCDVSWLTENLKILGHEVAVKEVEKYMCQTLENVPDEPESDDSDESVCQIRTFDGFLADINLQDKFPQKLTLKSFLTVKDKIEHTQWVESFWQRLTSLDYRAGYPQHNMLRAFSMRDFIFGVLHCADDFLRQDILEKMTACQLAIPVVLQGAHGKMPEFLLWALRRIMKKWKGKQDSRALEQPIVNYPMFVVSVLRIGDVRISKSQLINTMLSYSQGNTHHGYFLSKEKDFVKPIFSVGSIECAWFLPLCDNETEIFPEITTFLNLRGDCRNYPTQTEFTCRAADLTITLIATEKRNEFLTHITSIRKYSKKTLFVCIREKDKSSRGPQKLHKPKIVDDCLFVKVLQDDVLSRKICEEIAMLEDNSEGCKSLESLKQFCGRKIQIDENKPSCQEAKKQVNELFESFKTKTVIELKKECLPLQSILKDWVQIDKEKLGVSDEESESFEHQRQNICTRKRKKREDQVRTGFSKTSRQYHTIIDTHKNDPKSLKYVFAFMQEKIYQMVNDNTQKDMDKLSELEKQIKKHDKKYTKESNGQSREDKTAKSSYECLKSAYNALHKSCQLKNLGCEHFLRELGQLFEASVEVKSLEINSINMADIALLPSLAARLVAELHSFEIMDGDTGSVPLVWITNVLDNLTCDLGDPNILVISVIGVQSSGKSTLLNSMFGLRFPVRAGRCTRGLFFRLLELDGTLAKELGFTHLIVVDTEGIRSIDHDERRFDNELVTLALSIANVTIFNIEGENISPDMTGILQIAAHALMRMKEVDLECHCRMVQQRVSDLTAAERNKANTNRIMETLDEATEQAAEEEGLQGRYKKFSDVVDLQVDESLQYIPCLWVGGMSPPNHMYSDTVTKLKARIIQDVREEIIVPNMTLSHFTERVRDVWRAVREEDFLFNFQDSVRAVAFNQLCLEYNKWIVQMRQTMMNVTTRVLMLLGSEFVPRDIMLLRPGSVPSDTMSIIDENARLVECFDVRNPLDALEKLKDQIRTLAGRERGKLLTRLDDYIAKHSRRQSIDAYKKGFIDEAKLVIKDVENHALASVTDECELLRVKTDLPKFQQKWRYNLTLEAKKEAKVLEESGVTSITSSQFDEIWTRWMKMLTDEMQRSKVTIPVTSSALQTICEKLLMRVTSDFAVGSEVRSLFKEEGGIESHSQLGDCSKYIHEKFVKAWLMQTSNQSSETVSEQQLQQERENVAQFVQAAVTRNLQMLESDSGYAFDENAYQLTLQKTLTDLTATNKRGLKPTNNLIAKGLLYLSNQAWQHFVNYQNKHEHQCSAWLHKDKQMLFRDIQSFLSKNKKGIARRCAEFLHYFIEPSYVVKVRDEYMNQVREILDTTNFEPDRHLPWEFLRFLARTDPLRLINPYLSLELYCNVLESPSKLRAQLERLKEQIMEKYSRYFHEGERDNDPRNPLDFIRWLDILEVDSASTRLQDADTIFDSPSSSSVTKYLKRILRSQLETTLTDDLLTLTVRRAIDHRLPLCGNSCPQCGVPCNGIFGHHNEHFSFLHRPRGFLGKRLKNDKLSTEDCIAWARRSSSDAKSKRPNYKFSGWRILPGSDNPGVKFWQWVMAIHNNLLSHRFNCQKADIPSDWYDITEEDAINSLYLDEKTKLEGRLAATTGTTMPSQSTYNVTLSGSSSGKSSASTMTDKTHSPGCSRKGVS